MRFLYVFFLGEYAKKRGPPIKLAEVVEDLLISAKLYLKLTIYMFRKVRKVEFIKSLYNC